MAGPDGLPHALRQSGRAALLVLRSDGRAAAASSRRRRARTPPDAFAPLRAGKVDLDAPVAPTVDAWHAAQSPPVAPLKTMATLGSRRSLRQLLGGRACPTMTTALPLDRHPADDKLPISYLQDAGRAQPARAGRRRRVLVQWLRPRRARPRRRQRRADVGGPRPACVAVALYPYALHEAGRVPPLQGRGHHRPVRPALRLRRGGGARGAPLAAALRPDGGGLGAAAGAPRAAGGGAIGARAGAIAAPVKRLASSTSARASRSRAGTARAARGERRQTRPHRLLVPQRLDDQQLLRFWHALRPLLGRIEVDVDDDDLDRLVADGLGLGLLTNGHVPELAPPREHGARRQCENERFLSSRRLPP